MEKDEMITKIILGEITGKHQAIHAYDKIIWTVRTGYLTLVFAGWGILLKSIVDSAGDTTNLHRVLIAMMLVTIALSVGGSLIDQNYVRRKFRVIYALDSILSIIIRNKEEVTQTYNQLSEYIQVSGDKKDTKYLEVSGYKPAWHTGFRIYLVPVIMAAFGVLTLW